MIFKLRNFGKIVEADIKLDGITVICGDNNTGKSTVGKALFTFFNALNDYKNKIDRQKSEKLRNIIRNHIVHSTLNFMDLPSAILFSENTTDYIVKHDGIFTLEDVKKYVESNYAIKLPKERLVSLVNYLNTSESDILNEYVYRYITSVMNGQVKNVYTSNNSRCVISGEFKDFTDTIFIKKQNCDCELDEPIEHSAYYINNPFSLDNLNEHGMVIRGSNPMTRNIIEAIQKAQTDINEDSMTNILDSVLNKKELDDVRQIIKKAYSGDTIIDHGRYFYIENGVSFDFRNISTGLKSFALIERLLETGVLKRKDVLIFDEPEIHLHSEWQIIYAELIVILQKTFELTILLVTHSFQFLESLNFFMRKYEIEEKGNYYIPIQSEKGVKIVESVDSLVNVKKNLKSGMYTLTDMKLDELSDGDSDEEDNE